MGNVIYSTSLGHPMAAQGPRVTDEGKMVGLPAGATRSQIATYAAALEGRVNALEARVNELYRLVNTPQETPKPAARRSYSSKKASASASASTDDAE